MKTENWNNHTIRFVEVQGEWWAVAKDVADALGYAKPTFMVRLLDDGSKGLHIVHTPGGDQEMLIISEFGIYDAVFNSRRPEAKQFKRWVFDVIKQLRQSTGLEGFEVFRILDKEHQKKAMAKLSQSLSDPTPKDFIKANTIANKAVSNRFGYSKMVKKPDMTPEMLVEREPILDDTARLIADKRNYDLDIHVSQAIYRKWPA
ncbi:BRO-N domain-containing protein [Lacticaseibacillus pantheris]|uniref:BRO-N domain-containing protein n=1 Tax=Lacticaseibacillus pantheris TaxID=171523 RepID=UPI002659B35E|nr:BRO family protein [Lacticaseibacillus pantheris]WKF84457.1 BRO family protein [Lacticaseibacillus pantheris]